MRSYWSLMIAMVLAVVVLSTKDNTQAASLTDKLSSQSLYLYEGKTENTAVVEYTKGSVDFKSSKAPKVVVFYSPYCGHCINYAPKYMQLAKQMTKEYPQLEFYAVSCKAHRDVCAEHIIKGYPTIHVFKADSDTSEALSSRAATNEKIIETLELDERVDAAVVDVAVKVDRKLDVEKDGDTQEDANEDEEEEDESEKEEDDKDSAEDTNNSDGDSENAADNLEAGDDDAPGEAATGDADSDEEEDGSQKESDPSVDSDENEEDADEESTGEKVTANKDVEDSDVEGEAEESQDEADAESDEDNSEDEEADEEDSVVDMNEMVPPVADEEDTVTGTGKEDKSEEDTMTGTGKEDKSEDTAYGEHESAMAGATDEDEDESEDADEETDLDIDDEESKDEESSEEDLDRINDAPSKKKKARPGAGAKKGKTIERDMDKWKPEIAQKLEKYKKKRGRLGLGKKGKKGNLGPPADKEGATDVMKAHTPGTGEYKERMAKLLKKINKLRKKRGLPPLKSPIVGNKNSQLPVKKEVKKPRLREKVPILKHMYKMSEEEQLILDASLSFMAGLKYGVFMSNDSLTTKQRAALKGWLDLMSVSLPPEWGLHSLIDELNDNIDSISQSNENLQKILRKHPLPRRVWSPSCMKRDSPQGFSCGMWKLLHTSTVGIAEQRGGLNLAQQGGGLDANIRVFSPVDAADTIREYLAHFFGCIECRNHFIAQYDQCSFRRCDRLAEDARLATAEDWKQLALWLWEVHNDVSVRVAHERIEREMEKKKAKPTRFRMAQLKRTDEIKHLYPSLEECLQCFDDNGSWDEDNVFEFLESTYWSKPDATADKLLQYRGEEGSGPGFFWLIVIIVFALVYMFRGRNVDTLQRTVNAAMVTGRKSMGGTKKRSA